ncbi:MAG: pseudaminic acid cytidylyltransferase [Bacteroidales bacterium]|jgi:N-acylneuraminate cytidylyltransferase|nr:pseudaminic acid cytidylyltransferase [Bacteroidales bacterium]
MQTYKNIAIIPARGGSKRIPHKNIKPFLGKPIIAYSIEAAQKSGLFSELMVSTDDKEIAEMAKKYGATVPFFRSPQTANDFATIGEVIEEVLLNYQKQGKMFENVCCLLATAPFINTKRLMEAYDLMLEKKYDSVFPIVRFSYPIQRALRLSDGNVSMFQPENFAKRSQDLEPAYHDSGQFYWMKVEEFMKQKRFFSKNSGAIILPETEVQDIDSEEDWKLAEWKYKMQHE